jgi:nitrogen regulatory protein PII
MIKVEAIVIRDRVETVIDAVEEEAGRLGVTITEATGHGHRDRFSEQALLTFIVPEIKAERVADAISIAARTGNESGDGLVWMSPIYQVRHIRTGKPLHEYVEVGVKAGVP